MNVRWNGKKRHVAIDVGASSGRVFLGAIDAGELKLEEVSRFPNNAVDVSGTLCWDILHLYSDILNGIEIAARSAGEIASIGIDSWAVDYGLLDESGSLISNPVHYRDKRTIGVSERVLEKVGGAELYARTGNQVLPFNTLFQLVAAASTPQYGIAHRALLIPDLFNYWLTGEVGTEETNASTTQMMQVGKFAFDFELGGMVGVDAKLFPPLRRPGERLGYVMPDVASSIGISSDVPVISVASHDTASAVVGVPASGPDFAYISCGTWSIVGLELAAPIVSESSRIANFSNERGVDGTTRFLRNVMGLWLLQESVRSWSAVGARIELDDLLREASMVDGLHSVIDVDDPRFLSPGNMPSRIADYCRSHDEPVPSTPAEYVRCVLDSLAMAHRTTVERAQVLAGIEVHRIHLVGGGVKNSLLCQLTADASGLEVVAGPVEAAAIGNILVQARTLGVLSGGLDVLRGVVRDSGKYVTYAPDPAAHEAFSNALSRLPHSL